MSSEQWDYRILKQGETVDSGKATLNEESESGYFEFRTQDGSVIRVANLKATFPGSGDADTPVEVKAP